MTPKIIELNQAPVVLVYLPYQPMQIIDGLDRTKIYYRNEIFGNWIAIKNIPEFDSILGVLSDLTEEQFAKCVDKVNFESGPVYKNYKTFKGLGKASEAFDTLIESEKVYTENPVKVHTWASENADEYRKQWNEAQKRAIDPKRTVVLLKKK